MPNGPLQVLRSRTFDQDAAALGILRNQIDDVVRGVLFQLEREVPYRQVGSVLLGPIRRADATQLRRPRIAFTRSGDDVMLTAMSES